MLEYWKDASLPGAQFRLFRASYIVAQDRQAMGMAFAVQGCNTASQAQLGFSCSLAAATQPEPGSAQPLCGSALQADGSQRSPWQLQDSSISFMVTFGSLHGSYLSQQISDKEVFP